MGIRRGLLFILLFVGCFPSYGQHLQKMNLWQDSLSALGKRVFQSEAEADRLAYNAQFVRTLVSALKEPNSFYYNFDSLRMISVVAAEDKSFRIFSWNLPLHDGSYLYYGAIQHKIGGGRLKLTPLLDKTFEIKNPDSLITTAANWYGAQYYDIVPLAKNKYILLGWKGHTPEFTQKVIEVLTVTPEGEVTLGANLFEDNAGLVRKIFSYTKQATMYIQYNHSQRRIDFDHLVPADPKLKGVFKYYGPDLSYDSYKIMDGKLVFQEDIEVKNPENGDEDSYINPLKPQKALKSGLK